MKWNLPFSIQIKKRDTQQVNLKSPEGWFNLGNSSLSGETVTPTTAMKLSAVYACIRLNSENIASLPKYVVSESKGYSERITDHPVASLIHLLPNPAMTAFTFWETVMVNLHTRGNAFVFINHDNFARPYRLDILENSKVAVYKNDAGELYYTYMGETIPGYKMLHYRNMSEKGLFGLAPIEVVMDEIGLGLSVQRVGSNFYKNGAQNSGVVEMEGHMTDPQYLAWQDRWKKAYAGANNAFNGMPILEYGMKLKPTTIPLEQAQFIATRQFQLSEICRMFNVPPHLVGDLSKAAFSSLEQQDLQYAKYTLRGYCKRMEAENDIKLISLRERGRISTKFNLDGILRGDTVTRTAYYKEGIINGFLTRNEVRKLENMEPIAGLDEILVPLNMVNQSQSNNGQQ